MLAVAYLFYNSFISVIVLCLFIPIYVILRKKEDYKKRIYSFIGEIIDKYGETDYNILIVGHKDSTGMLSAYFENFKVETIYDDYLKLASPNCEYKKYIIKK